MVSKLERIVHYRKGNEPLVDVEQFQPENDPAKRYLMTRLYDADQPNDLVDGAVSVRQVGAGLYELEDRPMDDGRRPLVQAMLVHAALYNQPKPKTAVITLAQTQSRKIETYQELGFEEYGMTRTQDSQGQPLESEVILVNVGNTRLAKVALGRAGIIPETRNLPPKPSHPDKWQNAEREEQDY